MKNILTIPIIQLWVVLSFSLLAANPASSQDYKWHADTSSWISISEIIYAQENDGKIIAGHIGNIRYSLGRIDSGEIVEIVQSTFTTNTYIYDIVVKPNNNIVVLATYSDSMNVVLDGSSPIILYSPVTEGFIAEYDSNFHLVWHHEMNGTGSTSFHDMELVGNDIILSGQTSGNVDLDFGSGQQILNGPVRYIASYTDSWDFNWIRTVGGFNIKLSSDGNSTVYLAGQSTGNFQLQTENGYVTIGTCNSYVACFDNTGDYQWNRRTLYGGYRDIDADSNGNLYLLVDISSNIIFYDTVGSISISPPSSNGITNIGICKYASDGGIIFANTTKSTIGTMQSWTISAAQNSFFVGGRMSYTFNFSMDTNAAYYYQSHLGTSDAFYVKYDGSGNYQWAGIIGYSGFDRIHLVHAINDNSVLVGGIFESQGGTDFDPDPDVLVKSYSTSNSLKKFIANYTDCSLTVSYEDEEICEGDSIEIDEVFHYLDTVVLVPTQQYGQCSSSVYTEVIVNPLPPASLLNDSLFLCEGDSFHLGYLEDSIITAGFLTYNGNIYVDSIHTSHVGGSSTIFLDVESVDGCHAYDTCNILPEFLDTLSIIQTIINDSTVAFSTLTSAGLNGNISWDFDDGTTLTSAIDTVVYVFNNGNYLVCASGFGCNSVDACTPLSLSFPPLGVKEITNEVAVVFPNPAANNLTIEFQKATSAEIKIINLQGQIIYTGSISASRQTLVDVSSFPSGVYWIEIQAKNQVQLIPFTKS
ncbi:T9SS type A sorting domain-containing protein [bacterium]|nr:T9SS type A sorting domain-containing protein [bacterium]MDC1221219.1 T9SS type A sorting domain-containing protein [Salibacteraceae bacterium]